MQAIRFFLVWLTNNASDQKRQQQIMHAFDLMYSDVSDGTVGHTVHTYCMDLKRWSTPNASTTNNNLHLYTNNLHILLHELTTS